MRTGGALGLEQSVPICRPRMARGLTATREIARYDPCLTGRPGTRSKMSWADADACVQDGNRHRLDLASRRHAVEDPNCFRAVATDRTPLWSINFRMRVLLCGARLRRQSCQQRARQLWPWYGRRPTMTTRK